MTTRYHYDEKGNYRGVSLGDSDLALTVLGTFVVVPVMIFIVLRWVWRGLLGYSKLAVPYKWLVGYYYVVLAVPFIWAGKVSRWVSTSTPWPNLNIVLATLAFLVILLLPYALAILLLRRIPGSGRLVAVCVLGPFVVLLIWYAGSAVFEWLFVK